MTEHTVAALAAELGVTPRTLRFFASEGLVVPPYDAAAKARLVWVIRGRRLGLSLAEIKRLVETGDVERDDGRQREQLLRISQARIRLLEGRAADIAGLLKDFREIESAILATRDSV